MTNNADQEKWINEALSSTNGMVRASPSPDFFKRITAELANLQSVKTRLLPVKQWAAAAMLLLALNVGSVVYFTSRHSKISESATANPIAGAMEAESTYNY